VMLLPWVSGTLGKPPEKKPLNRGLGEGSRVQTPAGPPSFRHCFGGFLGIPGDRWVIWVYPRRVFRFALGLVGSLSVQSRAALCDG